MVVEGDGMKQSCVGVLTKGKTNQYCRNCRVMTESNADYNDEVECGDDCDKEEKIKGR